MLVVAKFNENYPVFACIRLISIVDPEEIYFLVRTFLTLRFSARFQAFEVMDGNEWLFT